MVIKSPLLLLSNFYRNLLLFYCKILKKRERKKVFFSEPRTSPVLLFLSLVKRPVVWLRSANWPLNSASHYEDIVKFSWGDVTEWISLKWILIISTQFPFISHLKIHLLHDMELNDPDLYPLYQWSNLIFVFFKKNFWIPCGWGMNWVS